MLPQKRWTYLEADETLVNELQSQLKIHPVLCKLLVLRNITTFEDAKDFFRPSLEKLHNPFLMQDMDRPSCGLKPLLKRKKKF
jgi:single-stranded-DNA-specific exonuclease